MPYPKANFPTSVWDGLSNNIDRVDVHSNVDPNSEDWERIASEVISLQSNSSVMSFLDTITSDTTLQSTSNEVGLVDSTAGDVTITLPPASDMDSKTINLKRIDNSVNSITIDADSSETIDGELTQVLNTQYSSITIISNGTGWYII